MSQMSGYGDNPSDSFAAAGYPSPPAHPPVPPLPPAVHRGPRRPVALLSAVALAAALLGGGAAAGAELLLGHGSSGGTTQVSSGPVTGASNASAGGGSVSAVAKAVTPSVVEIQADTQDGSSTGSGVVITKSGEVLTNNHVVSGADTVKVTLSNGTSYTGRVRGTDPDHDLALVDLRGAHGLKPAVLGDSDQVGVGDQVVAIGSPEGLSSTVTSGIVSAKDRSVTVPREDGGQQQDQGDGDRWPFSFGGGQYNGGVGQGRTTTYKALQTDAALNPGNSGGALVDMAGRVIGINSAMYDTSGSSSGGGEEASGQGGSVGLGFAIPVDAVRDRLAALRSGDGSS